MSSFDQGREIEAKGRQHTWPFISSLYGGRVEWIDDTEFQKTKGDFTFKDERLALFTGELKTERQFTGNFFLEKWSNRKRQTLGWWKTLNADALFYYFLSNGFLYRADYRTLKKLVTAEFIAKHNIHLAEQKEWDQPNDSWGWLVAIRLLHRHLAPGFRKWIRTEGGVFVEEHAHDSFAPREIECVPGDEHQRRLL